MPSPCAPKSPEEAGYTTKDRLLKAAREYPELRPCPKHRGERGTMQWVYRESCKKCERYDGTQQ